MTNNNQHGLKEFEDAVALAGFTRIYDIVDYEVLPAVMAWWRTSPAMLAPTLRQRPIRAAAISWWPIMAKIVMRCASSWGHL